MRPLALLLLLAAGCEPRGPNMTPGQDCMAGNCHRRFSVAGTIFAHADSQMGGGVAGALVYLTDADGAQATLETNSVGNFWTSQRFHFPITTEVHLGDFVLHMEPLVDRGSCNNCHTDPPTNGAAGIVYAAP
jgi:hypothetical protein